MRFELVGRVIEWRGPAPYFYVEIPSAVAAEISDVSAAFTYGWGVIGVEARIRDLTFSTSLFPKDGGYLLPLKDAVRRPLGLTLGDQVTAAVELRPPRR